MFPHICHDTSVGDPIDRTFQLKFSMPFTTHSQPGSMQNQSQRKKWYGGQSVSETTRDKIRLKYGVCVWTWTKSLAD